MRATELIMGMPITIEVVGAAERTTLDAAFAYFREVDARFSTYRADSEIEAINAGRLSPSGYSVEMHEVLEIAQQTKRESDGYFDIRRPDKRLDPSGVVKGWAIRNAARMLAQAGETNFFIEAGGDIQSAGRNAAGGEWRVGIRNPFKMTQIVKVLQPQSHGIATSGTYVRGQHIYDPHAPEEPILDIVSLTVIGPDVLEADRFATAAFAMGRDGIAFVQDRPELEGYVIDRDGRATFTSGFGAFLA